MDSSSDDDTDLHSIYDEDYQESLSLFCRGKVDEAVQCWEDLIENPIVDSETKGKAALSLGQSYNTGTGTQHDPRKAVELFKQAVGFGHPKASLELGQCLRYKFIDDENFTLQVKSAIQYFETAADEGVSDAMYELALCHLKGLGNLSVDIEAAISWLHRACEIGHLDAKYKLAQIYVGHSNVEVQ